MKRLAFATLLFGVLLSILGLAVPDWSGYAPSTPQTPVS